MGAASQPIINSAVYFSCTVHLLSSIKLVDEPNDQHHCSVGIQHREPTPVLPLSTPARCSQLLMWQEKCEHGFGKLQFSSPSSPRASKGKLAHSLDSWSTGSCKGLTPCTSKSSQRFLSNNPWHIFTLKKQLCSVICIIAVSLNLSMEVHSWPFRTAYVTK